MFKNINYAQKFQKIANDPIGTILEVIIAAVVNLFIPIPLAGEIAAKFKWQILVAIATFFIIVVFLIMSALAILITPTLSGVHAIQSFLQQFSTTTSTIESDPDFVDTQIPKQDPFGGSNMDFTVISAYFHDPNYYLEFGKQHEGVDLIPSNDYYRNSKTYQKYHQVIIFATVTGTVNHFIDQYGGQTVEIINDEGSLKTVNIHFSKVLVNTGDHIKAGTAIGVMGQTGDATGPHLHYQIEIKDGNTWDVVNPLNYIR